MHMLKVLEREEIEKIEEVEAEEGEVEGMKE